MLRPPEFSRNKLQLRWVLLMALRDSRRNLSRLFLFVSSIILGIAVLVSVFSLSENAMKDIDEQAKTLLGADLAVETGSLPDAATQSFLDSLGNDRASERNFTSMVYFMKAEGSRLVQVRAVNGNFPFYGVLETKPEFAAKTFSIGQNALVDQTLMLQYNAKVGDSIQVGLLHFQIAGMLKKAPGSTGISATVAPPVYIPLRYLKQAGLERRGSRISYNYFYRFDSDTDMSKVEKTLAPRFEKLGLRYETVATRKERTGRIFTDFNKFLTLIGFISLLLGAIGVSSSIQIYIRSKIHSIAVLRCLGVTGRQAFLIYLTQVAAIGLCGSIIGALLGTFVQTLLPAILKDFLPLELTTHISFLSISKGLGIGLIVSLLFALVPLSGIRKVSALAVLRFPLSADPKKRDSLRIFLYAIIFFFICLFVRWELESWTQAFVFTFSILAAFIFLVAVAWAMRAAIRRFFPGSWNYLWRQGFANLYRPNNQTLILMTTIGLGTTLIGLLYIVHSLLLARVSFSVGADQPNMVLFDAQTEQVDHLITLANKHHIAVLQELPVVSMRIDQVNGKPVEEWRQENSRLDSAELRRRRRYEGEIRASFRDTLDPHEKITAGKWFSGKYQQGDPIRVSYDETFASRSHLKIGDTVIFNVQGMLLTTTVGSFRSIDWQRSRTNFGIIFPAGVLERAPQFHVLTLRLSSDEQSAAFQRDVVRSFPNVSIIDISLVLKIVEDVLGKVGLVIRFMAGFCIMTGFIVLLASVLISKYQRMQEMVLLRTLGASRRQVLTITILEYFFVGAMAALTGIFLSLIGSWALAKFSFDMKFTFSWIPVGFIFLSVTALTILTGVLNSLSILKKPPLEILRTEVE
jgi:putative ABC transport system permease protein